MLRLRKLIERGLENRWLRFGLLLLLAILAMFIVIHGAHDQIHEAGLVCLALAILLVVALRPPQPLIVRLARATPRPRAPPIDPSYQVLRTHVLPPLRL